MLIDKTNVDNCSPNYFVIFNYDLPTKCIISKNITLHPYHVENPIGMTILHDVMIAEVNFTDDEIPDEYRTGFFSTSQYFSRDQLEIFLACMQISNQPSNEKKNIFNFLEDSNNKPYEILGLYETFPVGILSNSQPIFGFKDSTSVSENFFSNHNSIIDTVVNSSFYQFGFPFLYLISPTHISNSIEFYKKVQSITNKKNTKNEKETSRLLQNILLTYYKSKIDDTIVSISSSISIIESMFGAPENITMSIQERVPKYLGYGSEKLSKILRKMYDIRSVNAHLKYSHQFSSNPDLHYFYDNKRLISSLTTILIEKWVDEIFNGKTRTEFRTSIIDDEKYSKK